MARWALGCRIHWTDRQPPRLGELNRDVFRERMGQRNEQRDTAFVK